MSMKILWKSILAAFVFAIMASVCVGEDLNYISPGKISKVLYQAKLTKGGAVEVKMENNAFIITSKYSLMPDWAELTGDEAKNFSKTDISGLTLTAEAAGFNLSRKLIPHDECIEVVDSIKNLTSANLPIMHRHEVNPGNVNEYRLCGSRKYGSGGRGSNNINCTMIVMPESGGSLGLLALDDVFRAHFQTYAAKGVYGIADNNLALEPGKEITVRWTIFPSLKSGYYDQVNAMRRFLGVNYTIDGSFTFVSPYPRGARSFDPKYDRMSIDHPDNEFADYLRNKSAKYVTSMYSPLLGERYHGTACMNTAKFESHAQMLSKAKRVKPDCTTLLYFHCFLDDIRGMKGQFPGCETLTPSGQQADYRDPNLPLFIPTLSNKWGIAMDELLDVSISKVKVDGIYWDEFATSAAEWHYGQPWDGVSADINPRTHAIERLKSSVILLSLPWRLHAVEDIAAKGKFLIVNGGGAKTESMLKLFIKNKFVGFVETDTETNLYTSQLTTPIGLGAFRTERTEQDCYNYMVRFLDYGSVYYWYHQQVMPITHETLTSYMFPITPVELHEGYIIGKERIITNRSGWYSFGGNEDAEGHFFDKTGCEAKRNLESCIKDGIKYYKVVLSENETCALIKK